jgi:hypothetical protein
MPTSEKVVESTDMELVKHGEDAETITSPSPPENLS